MSSRSWCINVFVIISGRAICCCPCQLSCAVFCGDTGGLYVVETVFSSFIMFNCVFYDYCRASVSCVFRVICAVHYNLVPLCSFCQWSEFLSLGVCLSRSFVWISVFLEHIGTSRWRSILRFLTEEPLLSFIHERRHKIYEGTHLIH